MSLVQMPENQKHDRHGDFLKYIVASKLNANSNEMQLNTLLCVMESEAEKLYSSFSFKKKDEKNFGIGHSKI